MQTCKNWEKKLIPATMQNRTHIPLICSLCSFKSWMEKVCKHKETALEQKSIINNEIMWNNQHSPQESGWTGWHKWGWRSHWLQLPASPSPCRATLVGCIWGFVWLEQALHVLPDHPQSPVKACASELLNPRGDLLWGKCISQHERGNLSTFSGFIFSILDNVSKFLDKLLWDRNRRELLSEKHGEHQIVVLKHNDELCFSERIFSSCIYFTFYWTRSSYDLNSSFLVQSLHDLH